MIWKKKKFRLSKRAIRRLEREEKLNRWHDWFAWHPVRIKYSGNVENNYWAWLCYVKRKRYKIYENLDFYSGNRRLVEKYEYL